MSWTYFTAQAGANYNNSLQVVGTVNTVDDIDGLERPSLLRSEHDYALFKDDLTPIWENFPQGGRWMVDIQKNEGDLLDAYWNELMEAVVDGDLDAYNNVTCGLVVKVRKNVNKIGLWTENKDDEETNRAIGDLMKLIVGGRTVYYNGHTLVQVPGRPDFMYEM